MDQKWLDLQSEQLGEALAQQGLSLAVPMVLTDSFQPEAGENIARFIDHTVLKPDASAEQVRKACDEAIQYGFASVCINPSYVLLAANQLNGSNVKVCTVIGFPLGATSTLTKVWEARDAIANGAEELDMVIPIGILKEGYYSQVYRDIASVVEAANGRIVKVILETALLTKEEIVRGTMLARMAGAHFIKTSTGFASGGATLADVALMRRVVGDDMGVKASGGIRDRKTALAMIEAGATRIGTSSGVAIVEGQEGESDY